MTMQQDSCAQNDRDQVRWKLEGAQPEMNRRAGAKTSLFRSYYPKGADIPGNRGWQKCSQERDFM